VPDKFPFGDRVAAALTQLRQHGQNSAGGGAATVGEAVAGPRKATAFRRLAKSRVPTVR
jgi:hypothetical protein